MIKTYEDGWDCEPRLKRAVRQIEELDSFLYEINNCQRAHKLDYMVEEMKERLQEAIDTLDTIDTDKEYETIEDNR